MSIKNIQVIKNEKENSNIKIIPYGNNCNIFKDGSCIATFQFDGNAKDLCGNYNGTWVGNEQYAKGKFGQAAKFDGKSQIKTSSLFNKKSFTFSMWVKFGDIPTTTTWDKDYQNLINIVAVDNYSITLRLKGNELEFVLDKKGGSVADNITSISKLNDTSKFYHLVVTFDYETKKAVLYIDGKKDNSKILNINDWNLPNNIIYIGGRGDDLARIHDNSLIDQVLIFDRALIEEEIQILYNKYEILMKYLQSYRFNKIDNAFNQYGEVKIQVKFTAASKGLLLASADFENDEEEYLINTIMDFSSRSIKVTVPGLFYNYLVDENNVIQSFNFPGLTENTDYILELKYKTDSVNVKILDSSNKELFNREYLIGLLAYIGEEKLENTSFKFGVNTYSTDEAVSYFNFKDYLEEDFLYVGNRILDDDYLGVISLDNSVEFLTKQDYMKEAITMSLLNTPKFINKDSGITHYRYYLSKEKCPTNLSTTQPYPFIDLSFDTSKLKDDKGNYVLDHFYILVPFKFYEDNSNTSRKYCYPIIQINSDRLSVPFNSKSFSGYMRVFIDLVNKKITGEYLLLDSTINVSQLNVQWKTIKTVNLIEDKKTTIQFGLDAKYNHPYIYFRGIYFYKNNTNKYLVKSTFNMNLPMVDSATYPIQTEILSIQV